MQPDDRRFAAGIHAAGHRTATGDFESWREWDSHRHRAADPLEPAFWEMPMAYIVGASR